MYDLQLVDDSDAPLLTDDAPSDSTVAVAAYEIQSTFNVWTDGDAGLFFREVGDDGGPVLMPMSTFPTGDGATCRLNEPSLLMRASAHPSWDDVAEPERAFFLAMGYRVR